MIKIVAIDDNSDNLISLGAIIRDAFPDSILLTAVDGPCGIELAIENDPDVILLDIVMPGMDGLEVCRRIKSDNRISDIPIVFLTALKGDRENRLKALEIGAEGFLTKPIDETELIAQIKVMVKIKRAIQKQNEEKKHLASLVAERTLELEKSQIAALNLVEELKAENEFRKETEAALRESEELFRNIFEFHTAVKLIIDPDTGNIIDANRAAEYFYGWNKEQLKKMNIQDINLNTPEKIFRNMEMTKRKEMEHFEFQHRLADGSICDVEVFSSIIEIKGKSLLHSIVHDISSRKKAEREIKVSEARLRRAELASKSGNWELHLDSQTMFASNGASKIYGIEKEQFEYNAIKKIPLDEYRPLLDDALKKLIHKNKPYDIEFKIRTADTGEMKDIHSLAIYDKEKRVVFGIIQDITDRKKAENDLIESEARLRELNATKDKFFSIIAHDLKNPFNAIVGFSNLLTEQVRERNIEKIAVYAEIIQNSSQGAMDLLLNLLEWSRSQSGKMDFNPESFEINDLIKQAIRQLNDAAQQKTILISNEFYRKIMVSADKAMLGTVLRNLISNAIKFTQPGGEIAISVRQLKNEIQVSVSDNGIGIKKKSIDKLFRIDQNLTTLGTNNEKGTGLGLILCKEFVEKHGGRIWVESEVGIGSSFRFTFPKHQQERPQTMNYI